MILFEISREAFLPFLVCTFLIGIALGAIYDVFRIRRKAARRANKMRLDLVLTVFEDIVFCLFATVCMILATYKLHFGIPRWYAYVSCALGFFFWQKTLGQLVMKLSDKIIDLVSRALSLIKRKLLKPALLRVKKLTSKITAKRQRYKTTVLHPEIGGANGLPPGGSSRRSRVREPSGE
ncbi:MAG: spore cortex biosynthesis protein YabQ [Clostridia bacterium]|nr:spore cortex biosynthesis protein YabQ [Clostridia bacterium]